ncbi:hypothetical protein LCGC14_0387790 [marine sediment metagenome]|uniref:Uncharacterized protein n=1 Tax=marine sediment metagenome TaxID=412755 RepID=A0A0F9TIJ6_9ZZZZ
MGIHGDFDHELKIDSDTQQFRLVKGEGGAVMYNIRNIIPNYRDPLLFTQSDWTGGHGSFERKAPDVYFEGQSIDTTQKGRVFLGPLITTVQEDDDTDLDAAPQGFVWFTATSEWLCWTTGNIYRYDVGSSGKWTVASTTVSGVTHMAEFKGIMYAARGSSTTYSYSADGDTWTATDLTDDKAERFLVTPNPAGTADNLWKFKKTNELSRTTDGRTAAAGGVAWESPTFVGDTSHNITNIFLQNNKLMVGREDNLFHVDSNGGVHPFRDDLKINQSTNNYKYVTEWQTSVYHSEARGMAEITAYNSYDVMGPLFGIDDIGKVGDVVGLAGDKDWLYVAIDEGTNTIIYKCLEILNAQGKLQWQYCPWVFAGTNAVATIAVAQHSTTDFRLWFGYGNATAYVILSENPLGDSLARYAASGFLRGSYDYGTDPNWDKMWQSAVIEQHRVNSGAITAASAGETVQIKYRDDTDTSATESIAVYNTSGVVETNFTSALNNKRIQFEIHLASNTNTATPVVTFFQAKGVEKPTTIRIHDATYAIDDSPSESAETLRDLLRTGRTSTSLIRFANLNFEETTSGTAGTDYVNCVMEPGFPMEVEIVHLDGRGAEQAIQVSLREVSFS